MRTIVPKEAKIDVSSAGFPQVEADGPGPEPKATLGRHQVRVFRNLMDQVLHKPMVQALYESVYESVVQALRKPIFRRFHKTGSGYRQTDQRATSSITQVCYTTGSEPVAGRFILAVDRSRVCRNRATDHRVLDNTSGNTAESCRLCRDSTKDRRVPEIYRFPAEARQPVGSTIPKIAEYWSAPELSKQPRVKRRATHAGTLTSVSAVLVSKVEVVLKQMKLSSVVQGFAWAFAGSRPRLCSLESYIVKSSKALLGRTQDANH